MSALSYLMKMGGTQNKEIIAISKEIWEFELSKWTMITTEYMPGRLNVRADWASRNFKDSSEWLLSPRVFQKICGKWGFPELDLFTSRACRQIRSYLSWKEDLYTLATDTFQQSWRYRGILYTFPLFQ